MIYLIQGFFFQKSTALNIDPYEEKVTISEVTIRSMFSGIIGPDEKAPENETWVGTMMDRYGIARLNSVVFGMEHFAFVKVYEGRKDSIMYRFKKDRNGFYQGTFEGEEVESGEARCVLTTVPDDFLELK